MLCAVLTHQIGRMICVCVRACVPALRLLIFHKGFSFPTWKWSMLAKADFSVANTQQCLHRPSGCFSELGEDLRRGRHLKL